MIKRVIPILSVFLYSLGYAQVGINTDTPQAALEIKSYNNDANKVLRFSTEPTELDITKEYTLFAGIPDGNDAYSLRIINLNDVLDIEIPPVNRIITTNTNQQTFPAKNANVALNLDAKVFSSSDRDFTHDANTGVIEIKESGYYSVSAWISFLEIPSFEGDIILSIARKKPTDRDFSNFKRNVISRTNNSRVYKANNGIGGSFNFIEWFDANDLIRFQIANLLINNITVTVPEKGSGIILHKLHSNK